ncbi:hypothetical protein CC1G_14271 [Coprinopsis cinerea okayama7|uniref:DUF6533 domain-containing protein n=1 Tax=Coprinopsis cinerea (strain Okayama-7 / 130 / ATCC MYA-4618 / FGSC 9003) TaxID=240176 RepID=D6RLR3_COPC7|nr:hypothetical protein CC1G_14271 [Coprinopsis cinerea okayama7\|eukprot:XP_002911740.1 hypothetical protein CC1G_14271 [Coprinopsis cinerea okayama7\
MAETQSASRYYVENVAVASLTFFLCDYLQTLDEEVTRIWFSRLSAGKVLFFISRYTTMIDVPTTLVGFFSRGILSAAPCRHLGRFNKFSTFLGVTASEAILVISLSALLGSRKRYTRILAAIFSLALIACIAFLGYSFAVVKYAAPVDQEAEGCLHSIPPLDGVLICYYILLAGEFLITAIGFSVGLRENLRSKNSLILTLYRDGTVYYFILLALSSVSIAAVHLKPDLWGALAPWQRVLHPVLANRLLLNMRTPNYQETYDLSTDLEFEGMPTTQSEPTDTSLGTRSNIDAYITSSYSSSFQRRSERS